MQKRRHKEIQCALYSIAAILTLGVLAHSWGYRVNFRTPSAPLGVWKSDTELVPLKRGDYVRVDTEAMMRTCPAIRDAHEWGYFGHTLFLGRPYDLLKQVAGLPGATVDYDPLARRVLIDGTTQTAGILINADSRGHVMPRLSFPYRVPGGSYWLSSSNERGFDSRYFGSVPEEYIKSRMTPLFIW
jgi:conjugative transfer signal peptidase TraF